MWVKTLRESLRDESPGDRIEAPHCKSVRPRPPLDQVQMPTPLAATWNQCLALITNEIPRRSFKTWFEQVDPVSLNRDEEGGAELVLSVPSRFFGEWIESNYAGVLRKVTSEVVGQDTRIFFAYEKNAPEPAHVTNIEMETPAAARPPAPVAPMQPTPPRPAVPPQSAALGSGHASPGRQAPVDPNLRPGYTFDTFIEGECKRFARSAAQAIARQPGGTSFNPFLVYGGVGLGKTHLVQAIGNHARANGTAERILYISSEQFISQFVRAIQQNNVAAFSSFYRGVDLLVVDDIQFLSGKEKTQEEFFHVFNTLHQTGKQIVLCSDRPPSEIKGIEERLLSRFQWGLTADVQPADLETRCAILQGKAEKHGLVLEPDVVAFIAEHVTQNIRALEGALTRLVAHAQLDGVRITLSVARGLLSGLVDNEPKPVSIESIQTIVAEIINITITQLSARTRTRNVVTARHLAMYFSKEMTTNTLKSIGLVFGGRDHSTVICACNAVTDRMDVDAKFRDLVDEARSAIDRKASVCLFPSESFRITVRTRRGGENQAVSAR